MNSNSNSNSYSNGEGNDTMIVRFKMSLLFRCQCFECFNFWENKNVSIIDFRTFSLFSWIEN